MSSLLGVVQDLVSMASLPKKIVEAIEAPSPEVQATLNRSLHQATIETMTICFVVCKALLAERMGVPPSAEEVNDFMSKAADDPRFAHRAYRLFGEAQKTSDRRRRVFLASMLFGLPYSKMPDDDRDRVDMAVERMTIADIKFLAMIWAKRRSPEEHLPEGEMNVFGTDGIGAVITGTELRIATPNEWEENMLVATFHRDQRFLGDRAALASLVSIGCLDVGQALVNSAGRTTHFHQVRFLPLAHMVLGAMEEVRSGLAT
jgi:hypothetical protein